MTPPIPPNQARQRTARACLSCRNAKARCDGDPNKPGSSCTRCCRIGEACTWVPSRRMGRPRKIPRPDNQAPQASTSKSAPSATVAAPAPAPAPATVRVQEGPSGAQAPQPATTGSELIHYASPPPDNTGHHDTNPPPQLHTPPRSTALVPSPPATYLTTSSASLALPPVEASSPYAMPSPFSPSTSYASTTTFSPPYPSAFVGPLDVDLDAFISTMPPSAIPPPTEWFSPPPLEITLNSPQPANTALGPDREILDLVSVFFTHVHHFIPLLPDHATFLTHQLPTVSPLLLAAMCAIAVPFTIRPPSVDYLSLANTLLDSAMLVPVPERMAALLILVHIEYGMQRSNIARRRLREAAAVAVQAGLYRRDVRPSQHAVDLTDECAIEQADIERRLWWELYALDIMMQVVTGRRMSVLEGLDVAVDLPTAWAPRNGEELSAHALRLRILALLSSSSSPPPPASSPEHGQRLRALEVAISNMSVICTGTWTRASERERSYPAGDPEKVKWRAQKEASFMGLLMLNAASIHLQHLYNAPDLSLSFASCSLATPPPSPLSSPVPPRAGSPAPEHGDPPPAAHELPPISTSTDTLTPSSSSPSNAALIQITPPTSVSKITDSAQAILAVVREDFEMQDLRGARPSHSAFSTCGLVIASFGLLLGLASNPPLSVDPSAGWRAMSLISDLEMVEETLRLQEPVWPVARSMAAEVQRCKIAVLGGAAPTPPMPF